MNRLSILAATAVLVAALARRRARPVHAAVPVDSALLRLSVRGGLLAPDPPPPGDPTQRRVRGPPPASGHRRRRAARPGATGHVVPDGAGHQLPAARLSEAGIQMIIDAATEAGLLSGPTDFAPDRAPGSRVAEVVLVIDGVEYRISGDPDRRIVCVTTPCDASPGTPEAFGGFWAKLRTPRPSWATSSASRPSTRRSGSRSC